jgi:asparagine synthase (glutamine-hydrolysing)
MHYSLEARSPFAQPCFIEAAFSFNPKLKYLDGDEKYIFKQALGDKLVPGKVAFRKKAGFPVPPEIWESSLFESMIYDTVTPDSLLVSSELVSFPYLREKLEDRSDYTRSFFARLVGLEMLMRKQDCYIN